LTIKPFFAFFDWCKNKKKEIPFAKNEGKFRQNQKTNSEWLSFQGE